VGHVNHYPGVSTAASYAPNPILFENNKDLKGVVQRNQDYKDR